MNRENQAGVTVVALVLMSISMFLGALFANTLTNDSWQREAIEKGFAQYNAKTGAWEWIKAAPPSVPSEQPASQQSAAGDPAASRPEHD